MSRQVPSGLGQMPTSRPTTGPSGNQVDNNQSPTAVNVQTGSLRTWSKTSPPQQFMSRQVPSGPGQMPTSSPTTGPSGNQDTTINQNWPTSRISRAPSVNTTLHQCLLMKTCSSADVHEITHIHNNYSKVPRPTREWWHCCQNYGHTHRRRCNWKYWATPSMRCSAVM